MKRRPYAFVIIGALVLMLVVFAVKVEYNNRCENRIIGIKIRMGAIRNSIHTFLEHNGRYPDSLDEFRRYIRDESGYLNVPVMYVDLTSEKQSDVPEYRQLNDKGGYYYDPNTGEVRLNLIRPVKDYLKWYNGKFKDQVPSTW